MSVTQPPKPRRGYWKILACGFGSILLVLALFKLYLWYLDHKELAVIDALLAEQDRIRPGWRWSEFQPEASKLGDKNGAIRFIEVGKKLTQEMLALPEVEKEDDYFFPDNTKEKLTTLESRAVKQQHQVVRERCQSLESHLPQLQHFQLGCPPYIGERTSAQFVLGIDTNKKEPVFPESAPHWARCSRWLVICTKYWIEEGNGDQASSAWLALYNQTYCEFPGALGVGVKSKYFYNANRLLYQLISKTQPGSNSLEKMQLVLSQARSHLFTLDDIHSDRAWIVQLLQEMVETKGMELLKYRVELTTHLRWLDQLESVYQPGKPLQPLMDIDDTTLFPGPHFQVYMAPRWRAILANVRRHIEHSIRFEALLAAERFRVKNQRMPIAWSDLVPAFLPAIPMINEQPLSLKQVPDGVVIYQVGHSNKDQGGKVLCTYDPETKSTISGEETDEGLILFHPHLRRQPPPPREAPKQQENQ